MMRVSVVIPTYFRRNDLSDLLASILSQTYKPIEVIIVDDTPTTEIENLCEEYKDKFAGQGIELIYVRNHKVRSAAIARNIGVERAKGDIILFLDSDVVLFEDFIEKIVEVFREKPHALGVQGYMSTLPRRKDRLDPLRDVFNRIFHTYYRYPENSCRLFEYPSKLTKVIECEWMSGCASAYRREVFNEFKFDENLKGYSFMEDVLLSHSIFKKHPKRLFITPFAKYVHKFSPKNYEVGESLEKHKKQCRKYVLRKLFGFRGILFYYRQEVGFLLLKLFNLLFR